MPQSMVERAVLNFRKRLQNCIDFGGRHLKAVNHPANFSGLQ